MSVDITIDTLVGRLIDPAILDEVGSAQVSRFQRRIIDGAYAENSPLTQSLKAGSKPLRNAGTLLSSIKHKVVANANAVEIGTAYRYAKILHFGGVIRPKQARYLTIPAGPKTKDCMRKYGFVPRECIAGMGAAGWKIWPSFTKSPVILAQWRKNPPFVLFILKRSVTIPARPFLELTDKDRSLIARHFRRRYFA